MRHAVSFDQKTAQAATALLAGKPICAGAAAMCIAALFAVSPIAQANGGIAAAWVAQCPASQSNANAGCLLCHYETATPTYNVYGISLSLNGANFAALNNDNSDGDPTGASNLAEINADPQPGWTDGAKNLVFDGSANVTNSAATPPQG